jgi:outer membrane receptor for ferrienterochelin and colicin
MQMYCILVLVVGIGINICSFAGLIAQQNALRNAIEGIIYDELNQVIPEARIFWIGTGFGTISDLEGRFSLLIVDSLKDKRIVIRAAGWQPDTFVAARAGNYRIVLRNPVTVAGVTITAGNISNFTTTAPTEIITRQELTRAACCNLSESFSTNTSVDVQFTDAVLGIKQIQLLGLSGTYAQLQIENRPGIRGLMAPLGLHFYPGPWIESIQVGKGTGSVVNGYESLTGQINVELLKPESVEKLLVNNYVNHFGRTETNVGYQQKLNDKWSALVLGHVSQLSHSTDRNNDGFMDMPAYWQVGGLNRWKFQGTRGLEGVYGIQYLREQRIGGQLKALHNANEHANHSPAHIPHDRLWQTQLSIARYEAFAKTGYVFPKKPYKSIGTVANWMSYRQNGFFGLSNYSGAHDHGYLNLIYQTIIGCTDHTIKTGISFSYEKYNENIHALELARTERVPGIFIEYTYLIAEKLSLVAGMRADRHNLYGSFITPRLHFKYSPWGEKFSLRIAGGKGTRVANVLADNFSVLASNRNLVIADALSAPEIGWNYGLSIQTKSKLFNRQASMGIDFFRTDFVRQVIADRDLNTQYVYFYQLKGASFSNAFQFECAFEPVRGLQFKGAYKFYDVRMRFKSIDGQIGPLRRQPLNPPHRILLTLNYQSAGEKWQFDVTAHSYSSQRLPDLVSNPETLQLAAQTPPYWLLNAQISRKIGRWRIYAGCENITDFFLQTPILDAAHPYGNYFDASMVWGPTMGRMFYSGVTFSLPQNSNNK